MTFLAYSTVRTDVPDLSAISFVVKVRTECGPSSKSFFLTSVGIPPATCVIAKAICDCVNDFRSLLLSLRGIGTNKINTNYRTTLMGKETWKKAQTRYESLKNDQGLPLSYELFYALAKRD